MKIRIAAVLLLLASALRGEDSGSTLIYDHVYATGETGFLVRFERVDAAAGFDFGIAQVTYDNGQWEVFAGQEYRGGLNFFYLELSPALDDFELLREPQLILDEDYRRDHLDSSVRCTVPKYENPEEGQLSGHCIDSLGNWHPFSLTRMR